MTEHEIFVAAIKLTGAQRVAFLDAACGQDGPFRQQVDALLNAHDESGGLMPRQTDRDLEVTQVQSPQTKPGTTIAGRYKLLEAIGEGGMGTVWMAEQKEPVKRKVAIKLVKAGMDSAQVLARFDAERQALALMDHPNIAKVFDGGVTEQGRPYFVMEFVMGVPLTEYCDQARLSVRQRLELFAQICQAVQHAHQKGIIHRDLKPSNLLICLYDGKPVPKIIDFGLAKAMHQSLTEQTLHTALGMMVGTPLYMSPEQAEHNNLDVDTRTDIYSLGVILYELLTGSTPLERQQLKDAAYNEILRLIKEIEPPKPSTRLSGSASLPSIAAQRSIDPNHLRKSLTGDLDWIAMKALEKERGRRYETANGLALDIQRHLVGEAVLAAPPSAGYRFKKFLRRHKGPVIAVGLMFLALLAGIAGTTWGLFKATDAVKAELLAKTDADNKRAEAEEQRARAEQREQEAIDAVKRFGDAVADNRDLKNSPQLESLRTTLLDEPLAFFKSLRERLQAASDTRPGSLARLGDAALELAKLTSEIGDKRDALQAVEQALKIFEGLSHENPGVSEIERYLAVSHHERGVLLLETGQHSEAMAEFAQARSIRERLLSENPAERKFQTGLAATLGYMGQVLSGTGNAAQALESLSRAREIHIRLARDNPEIPEFRHDLAASHYNIAVALLETGDLAEALASCERAVEIQTTIGMANPVRIETQIALASSHSLIGRIHKQNQNPQKSNLELQQAKKILVRVVRDNPTNSEARRDLARNHWEFGDLHRNIHEIAEAHSEYEHARIQLETLWAQNPTFIGVQTDLAETHSRIALLLLDQLKHTEALIECERAATILTRFPVENLNQPDIQTQLATIYYDIAEVHNSARKPVEALAAYELAKGILKELASNNPDLVRPQHTLAMSEFKSGIIYNSIGKPTEALEALGEASARWESLARDHPSVITFRESRATALGNMAHSFVLANNQNEAIASYERQVSILREIVVDFPQAISSFVSLGGALNNWAQLKLHAAQAAAACTMLREAVQCQKRVLAIDPLHSRSRQFLEIHYTTLLTAANELGDRDLATEARRGLSELVASDPQFAALDVRLAAALKGEPPADNIERLAFAQRAYGTHKFALAARLWTGALAADPTLADDRQAQHRYNAACCAALAASGQSIDEPPLDDAAEAKLRGQALAWLQEELDRWETHLESATPEQHQAVAQTLKHWQQDPDLASLRGDAIDNIPDPECDSWRMLWEKVEALRLRAG